MSSTGEPSVVGRAAGGGYSDKLLSNLVSAVRQLQELELERMRGEKGSRAGLAERVAELERRVSAVETDLAAGGAGEYVSDLGERVSVLERELGIAELAASERARERCPDDIGAPFPMRTWSDVG